jgi:hypothetical protein
LGLILVLVQVFGCLQLHSLYDINCCHHIFVCSVSVLQEQNFISSGIMASSPYNSLNGENFVALDWTMLWTRWPSANHQLICPSTFLWYSSW